MLRRCPLLASALGSLLCLAACGAAPADVRVAQAETSKPMGSSAPGSCDPAVYPCGPYGYLPGDVIPNFTFVGREDSDGDGKVTPADPVKVFHLSDYYGRPDLKVLVLLTSAEWCGPCNLEQGSLITEWAELRAKKTPATFLEVLTESDGGDPADIGTVDRWIGKEWTDMSDKKSPKSGLTIGFPVAADPTDQSSQLGVFAIPASVYITTSDMTIQLVPSPGYAVGRPSPIPGLIASLLN